MPVGASIEPEEFGLDLVRLRWAHALTKSGAELSSANIRLGDPPCKRPEHCKNLAEPELGAGSDRKATAFAPRGWQGVVQQRHVKVTEDSFGFLNPWRPIK